MKLSILLSKLQQVIIIFLLEAIFLLPFYQNIPVVAAATPTPAPSAADSSRCASPPDTTYSQTTPVPDDSDAPEGDMGLYGIPDGAYQQISPLATKDNWDLFTQVNHGMYDSNTKYWYFCSTYGLGALMSVVPGSIDFREYMDTLLYPFPRIEFENPTDYYALTGEPCTLFNNQTKTCSEDGKTYQPRLDDNGQPVLDSNGQPEMVCTPKYYTDVPGWNDCQWDAPKADARILESLVYLVTPRELGGAGREYIKVGSVLQPSKTNNVAQSIIASNTDTSNPLASTQPNNVPDNAQYFDLSNPQHPTQVSQAFTITQIDKLRVTTKIVSRTRLGGDSTKYQYSNFPIQAQWQTGQNIPPLGTTPNDIYSGALGSFNNAMLGLINQFDLTASYDPSTLQISSLGDIASTIGQSLVTQLLKSPDGSLSGWDFPSLLDSIGRAYIAGQLNLPPGALAEGDSVDDLLASIGRATVENAFKLPSGSLEGKTSEEIYDNLGRRFLEASVLKVSPGTLEPSSGYPITNHTQLLERLGEGKIEDAFKLPAQSARVDDWNKIVNMNYKTKLIFKPSSADYIDEQLGLGYEQAVNPDGSQKGTNSDGFTAQDFAEPTKQLFDNPTSAALEKYKQLIGSRVLEQSIGRINGQVDVVQPTLNGEDFIQGWLDNLQMKIYDFNTAAGQTQYRADGSPEILATFKQGVSNVGVAASSVTNSMRSLNIITQADLQNLASQLLTAKETHSFTPGVLLPTGGTLDLTPALSVNLYNQLHAFWFPISQTVLDAVNAQINRSTSDANRATDDKNTDDQRLNVQGVWNRNSGILQQYEQLLINYQSSLGQSGRSAALNIPGTIFPRDNNGNEIVPANTNQDPINRLLDGDLSQLGIIGRMVAAKTLSDDRMTEESLAAQLNTDLQPLFNLTQKVGINDSAWTSKGFLSGDFERIFTKDLGQETFQRIGQTQLLTTLWNDSGLAQDVSKGAEDPSVQQFLTEAQQVVQQIDFYTTRIDQLRQINKDLEQSFASLPNLDQPTKDLFASLDGQSIPTSIKLVQNFGQQYEVALKQYENALDPSTDQGKALEQKVVQGEHLLQEIAAGHALTFNTPVSPNGGPKKDPEGCWDPSALRQIITSPGTGSIGVARNANTAFREFSRKIAACRLDIALQFPLGTMSRWYQSNDSKGSYSVDSLELAIGQAYASDNKLSWDDKKAHDYGQTVLEGSAVLALASLAPGISHYLSEYKLNGQDVYNLLVGNTTPVLQKIGAQLMDTYLGWKPGTAIQIINPQCLDPTTQKYGNCSKDDATRMRLNSIAEVGLSQLGLDLNFPLSLDLRAKGDFATNFGDARISEDLGLQPNSFQGSFTDVRNANSKNLGALLSGFGWSPSPFVQKLTTLRNQVLKYSSDYYDYNGLTFSDPEVLLPAIDKAINELENKTLDQMSDQNSALWSSQLQATPPWNSVLLVAAANQMFAGEYDTYKSAVAELMDAAQSAISSSSPNYPLVTALSSELSQKSEDDFQQAYLGGFVSDVTSFLTRLQSLDTQYSAEGAPKGAMYQFIWGQVNADTISKPVATKEIGSKLVDKVLDQTLGKNSPVRQALADFQQLTKTSDCPGGLTVSDFLLGSPDSSCGKYTLKDVSLSAIFDGKDALDIQKRGYLYDRLLSRTWGAKLEEKTGFQKGTFRAIALEPWMAREIVIDQGIQLIGTRLFSAGQGGLLQYDPTDPNMRDLVTAVKNAYYAGFCSIDTDTGLQQLCTLRFDQKRSIASLNTSLDTMLDQQFQRSTGLGDRITLADVAMIASGGMDAFKYLGAQRLAAQLNQDLTATGDSRANNFKITYSDLRNAFRTPTVSPQELTQAVQAEQADRIFSQYDGILPADQADECANNPFSSDYCSLYYDTDSQLVSDYINGKLPGIVDTGDNLTATQRQQEMDAVAEEEKGSYLDDKQKEAQDRLQYQVYDILAFKADHNIPVGFTYAMLKGNQSTRSRALSVYILNSLHVGTTVFNGYLTSDDIVNLYDYAQNGFKDSGNLTYAKLPLNALDRWFQNEGAKLLGVKDLPPGLASGLFAWGSTGFNGRAFDRKGITMGSGTGAVKVDSIGTVLKNWGLEKLFSWGDKELGFSPGSVAQIYQAASQVIQASQILKTAHAFEGLTLYGAPVGKLMVQGARANLVKAKAELVALVVTIVFAKQISTIEQGLGLVPGTGALAVTMLVEAAMGVPIDPVTLGLFVIGNLFGVYAVDVYIQATGDGYYPFHTPDPTQYPEWPSPDYPLGTFDAKSTDKYQAGVTLAAQHKVQGVLRDLLLMPDRWSKVIGDSPTHLWVSQLYTAREEDGQELDYLASQPAPWDNPPGLGYGDLQQRTKITRDPTTGAITLNPKDGYQAGLFYSSVFNDSIRVRW